MAIQKIQPSFKFNEEQLKQLRQIAPEVEFPRKEVH